MNTAKPVKCPTCGKSFASKTSYGNHIRWVGIDHEGGTNRLFRPPAPIPLMDNPAPQPVSPIASTGTGPIQPPDPTTQATPGRIIPKEERRMTTECTSESCRNERTALRKERDDLAALNAQALRRLADPFNYVSLADMRRHCTDGSCKTHAEEWDRLVRNEVEARVREKWSLPEQSRVFRVEKKL